MGQYIGTSVKRKEDDRFVSGKGHYTDDIVLPNMTYAYILRSQHAHARINSINTGKAKAHPGVVGVFTGEDLAGVSVPCGWAIGDSMKEPPHPPLAVGKVRHVGDCLAVVIAENRYAAKDAAELVEIDFQALEAVTDATLATESGAPVVHDEAPDNVVFNWELGDKAAADDALASAAHVTRLEFVNQRLIANAIEPRSAIGDYDSGKDELTLYTSSQNPHLIRLLLCAFVLGIPEHKVRVISPDVGGGFGSKIFHYPEEVICAWATRQIGRPVKWTAERSESFVSDAQGRDHNTVAEMGFDKDGNILGLRVKTVANLGAYLSTFGPGVPTWLYGTLLTGQYKTKNIYVHTTGVFTNTTPVDAYRGAGRPEATFVVERLVDTAAHEMNIDSADLRRKNMIPPDAFPYETPVVMTYDSGNYEQALDKALSMIDYKKVRAQQQKARANGGKLIGVGFSSYIEACGIAPSKVAGAIGARAGLYEGANVRVHPTGKVTVFTGSHSHGQGHETTFAQVVADGFGISVDDVDVVHGDTAQIPFGMGTYGSRSIAVGGSAIYQAVQKIKEKARKIAAHKLEASEDDLEFADGNWTVKGTDKSVGFGDVALTAYVPHDYPEDLEPGLEDNAFWDPKNFTFPFGTHIGVVEIDPDTGKVDVVRYVAADDVGNVINPMIVDGQLHGGIAQGIGQALWEGAAFDDSGQLITGSMMDYALPRADNLPSFEVDRTVTPCPDNPLGVKGAGEAGTIASTACIVNAVVDALSHLGVRDVAMPMTPERVWRAIHGKE